MPFYHFRQNNSGGSFIGPIDVIVEAPNYVDANNIAETVCDIYFDGCSYGIDCSCCGDRWHRQYDDDEATAVPMLYSASLDVKNEEEFLEKHYGILADDFYNRHILIQYLDGTKRELIFTKDHHQRARDMKRANTKSIYGFIVTSSFISEAPFQAWQADYDPTIYWDKEGNSELLGLGWKKSDNPYFNVWTFGASTLAEAESKFQVVKQFYDGAEEWIRDYGLNGVRLLKEKKSKQEIDKIGLKLTKTEYNRIVDLIASRWSK